MAIRKVARMGNPILRQKAREVSKEELLSPSFKQLIEDMVETMRDYGGIGLAAPQVYESIQLALIEISDENLRYPGQGAQPLLILVNPKITVLDSELSGAWEGCLSVPELRGWVERPRKIRVDYLDLSGVSHAIEPEGFLATVFQHELDHLDGVLYLDRVRDTQKLAFLEEYHRYWLKESEVQE